MTTDNPTSTTAAPPTETVPLTPAEMKAGLEAKLAEHHRALTHQIRRRDEAATAIKGLRGEIAEVERILRAFEPHHRGPRKATATKKAAK